MPPQTTITKVIIAMSIWQALLPSADKGNVTGYICLFLAALLSGATYIAVSPYAQYLGLVAAVFTVAGVFLTFWTSSVRDRHADLAIHQARSAADEAHALASKTEPENTQLKLRLYEQEQSHLNLLAKTGPRTLTATQVTELYRSLAGYDLSQSIVLVNASGGDEVREFASTIAGALSRCGIRMKMSGTTIRTIGGDDTGVEVIAGNGMLGREIAAAVIAVRPDFRLTFAPSAEAIRRDGGERVFDEINNSVIVSVHPKAPL